MWEGPGDRTELQHIEPHSIGHNRVSFPFSWAAQPGAWGPHSAGWWLSLLHLVTNGSGLQTNWLPVFTELYYSSTTPSSCERHKLHSFNPSTVKAIISWLFLDRMLLLGAFPILTARPGRRSIYNICCLPNRNGYEKLPVSQATVIPRDPHRMKKSYFIIQILTSTSGGVMVSKLD